MISVIASEKVCIFRIPPCDSVPAMPTLEEVRLRSSSHRLHNLLQRWDCLQSPPDQRFGSFLWSSLIVVIFDCGHLWLWSLHDARFSPLLEHTGAPIPTKYFWRAPPTFGSRARTHKKRSGVQQRCVSSWAWLHGSGFLTTMSDLF